MTTASTTPRLALVGDGSSTQFTFNFQIADSNSIAVYVGTSLKVLTSDYTITFDSGSTGTGKVVFNTAPADAAVVYLIRDTDNIRAVDFAEGGAFFAATVNAELDRLTQGLQDLENIQKNSTVRVVEPHTESATLTLPSVANRASKLLSFDGSGNVSAITAGTGTMTSITAGTGLSGGTITGSGTIAIDTATTVDKTTAQTLTNKTINTADNTITVVEADISDLGSYITASSSDTLTNKAGAISQWTNDSAYATETYVGTQITNLIDSAPGALNTLNELAAALGDDADFATTVTNSLATKVTNTDTGLIVVGDDSSGTALTVGETIKIAGAGGITTAVSGDTLTITGPSGTLSNIVEDLTPELGGNLNVNSNTITNTGTNGEVRLETNGSGVITLAPGSSGSVQVTIGNVIVTQGTIENNAVSIDDNKIATYRSNDNLILDAAGTGKIQLNANITGSAGTVTVDSIVDAGSNAVKSTHTPAGGSDLTNKDYIDGQGFLTGVELSTDLSPQLGGSLDLNSQDITGTGNISITGNIANDAVSIADNTIATIRSNDNLVLSASGTGHISVSSKKIINLADPAADQDAATKAYVDSATSAFVGSLSNIVEDTTPQLGGSLDVNGNSIVSVSNGNIIVQPNGTGVLQLGAGPTDGSTFAWGTAGTAGNKGVTRSYTNTLDLDTLNNSASRLYANTDNVEVVLTGSGSGNSGERIRQISQIQLDTAGFNTSYHHGSYQSIANIAATYVGNSGAATSSVREILGIAGMAGTADSGVGDMNVTDLIAMSGALYPEPSTGITHTITNGIGQLVGVGGTGAGTATITNFYGLYVDDALTSLITNPYGIYVKDADYNNVLGGITLQSGDITTPAITIADNSISTNRSNDDLLISASGTGTVRLGTDSIDNIKLTGWTVTTGATNNGAVRTYERSVDLSTLNVNADRIYANCDVAALTLTASGDGNSNERFRQMRVVQVDTAGFDTLFVHSAYQSIANIDATEITNSSATASTLTQALGTVGSVAIGAGASNAGDITVTDAVAMSAYVSVGANTGTTVTATNAYGQMTGIVDVSGSGTRSIGTYYGVYVNDQQKAIMGKAYGLYIKDDDYLSKIGKIEAYKESINALTSSATITVDCALAPVHTVTLGVNTEFNISNLGTGQTVTLIITQDGTGNRSASFGTDGSTAVKFAGGVPSLSAGGGDIDIVSVFNDGTNYLGNIAKDYS